MTNMNRIFIYNQDGKFLTPLKDFQMKTQVYNIAMRRTHAFAFELAKPHSAFTLRNALVSSYIQGMYDATRDQA